MKTRQKNLRMPDDVIIWIEQEAEKDQRNHGQWLGMLIKAKLMPKAKKKPTSTSVSVVSQWCAPLGLNVKAWSEFEQHRKDMKKPLTDTARTKAANQICELTEQEQQATIDKSIQSRWAGLFPEKAKDNKSFIERQNDSTFEQLFGKGESAIEGECDVRE